MGVLTAVKRPKATELAQPGSDEQELRQRCGQVAAQLNAIEAELRQVEAERDAAEIVAESVRSRAGGSVELWRAEESYDAANKRITELVEQREPIAAQYRRMADYLTPIDKEREQLDVLRRSLAAWEILAKALPLLDQIAELVEAAEKAGVDTERHFHIPNGFDQIVRQYGPQATGLGRHHIEYQIGASVEGHRAAIARLEGRA